MTTARRRIVRPNPPPQPDAVRQRRLQRLQANLAREQAALDRWWQRLRRALNAVAKHQKAVTRLEKQRAQAGGTTHGPNA